MNRGPPRVVGIEYKEGPVVVGSSVKRGEPQIVTFKGCPIPPLQSVLIIGKCHGERNSGKGGLKTYLLPRGLISPRLLAI